MLVSIVIRTLNEEKYLNKIFAAINSQTTNGQFNIETVIIDSGSVDATLDIAKRNNARITSIKKSDFTFGRSLNMGCDFSNGDILVFLSGHCIPVNSRWLLNMVDKIEESNSDYVYGRQMGRDLTKYSEKKIFDKYFPDNKNHLNDKIFCNNANSAIKRSAWSMYKFNEELTGLEDMELAKRLIQNGGKVSYAYNSLVYHIHDESWAQTKTRYERESFALQFIMPEVQVSFADIIRYITTAIISDFRAAAKDKILFKELLSIIKFRIAQYIGTYKGNKLHKTLSNKRKESYYYPINKNK